ncbi:MAG: hypothetical protein Q4G69_08725 [Planctomycetia bacterium]|nr:hypothetical protein [Planctomycetia bacterium]
MKNSAKNKRTRIGSNTVFLSLLLLILPFLFSTSSFGQTTEPGAEYPLWSKKKVKMIELSWSNPTVEFLAKNIQGLERSCPMNGITVRFYGSDPNKKKVGTNAMSRNPWKYEWFKETMDLYKKIPFKKLTDNFFYTVVSPGDADWFKDEDWAAVCNNYGIAARVAKETGMRGICFDIEEYGIKFWDFSTIKTGQTYEQAYKMARQRGEEWGKAVFGAYPEIAILALHMMSYGGKSSSLTVPFFNGVISVMPTGATLHDGLESASYHAKKATDYDAMSFMLDRKYLERIEISNVFKYRTQIKLAPGFYMDGMFTENKESIWHKILQPEIGENPKEFFRRNLMSAERISDEFIWIYGEKGAWWTGTRYPLWEDRVPGITNVVLSVNNPEMLITGDLANLLKNPEFKEKKKDWNFWQIEQEKKNVPLPGRGFEEDGLLKIEGVTSGCFVQSVPVEPGSLYYLKVTARYENETRGFGSATIAFKDKNQKWNHFEQKKNVPFPKNKSGWITETILFTVPEDSHYISVQMGANNLGKGGQVAFQKIALFKL